MSVREQMTDLLREHVPCDALTAWRLAGLLEPIATRVAREAACEGWSRRYDPEPLDDIVRRVMEGGQ